MPNIIFYLNSGAINKEEKAPLMAKIIYKGKRYYKTIARIKALPEIKNKKGEIIGKGDWNLIKSQVYTNHKKAPYNGHVEINATINELKHLTKKYNDYCLLNDQPVTELAIENILKGIDPIIGKKSANIPDIDFMTAFKNWVDYSKANNEFNTYKVRNTVYNFLNDFGKDKNTKITFNNVNMLLFDMLKEYAVETKHYSKNTFAKSIKIIKTFLKWCKARDYFTGEIPADFRASEHDITPVTLTVDEFKTLFNFDFENKKHRKVRDIFCTGCLTGLRFSDLQRIKQDYISEDYLVITTQKTKEPLKIPILPMAREIFERYKEQPVYALPRISNQKFNVYLREACQKAEIKAPVTIDSFKGNQFSQETKPKHEVMSAHVARKTFITLSFFLGMNIKIVQEITGINQEKTLRKYLQIADSMKKTEMEKAWNNI